MAAKIKDGLFIGDAETSQSEVFINDNKISNLVNLAGKEVHNVWASHGLVYLTYYWEDRPNYTIFTGHEDPLLTDIVEFIDVSIEHGISVLLFSRNGTGRCVVAACVYLMMKFHWGFEKTYDYVYSKKPDIELNKGFIQQMFALDMKLLAARQKSYAQRCGIENTFKIEATMTISDIAAMLPLNEAKRWNAWEPDYITQNSDVAIVRGPFENDWPMEQFGNAEEHKAGGSGYDSYGGIYRDGREGKSADFKSAAATSATARKRAMEISTNGKNTSSNNGSADGWQQSLRDKEDELVLIYSFVNSKNTISTLPGPYYNAYDVPKQFRLRFNEVMYEEDVNMFPMAPTNARFSAAYAPRGVLKGSRRKHQLMELQRQQAIQSEQAQPKTRRVGSSSSSDEHCYNDDPELASTVSDSKSATTGAVEQEERRAKRRLDSTSTSVAAGIGSEQVSGAKSSQPASSSPTHTHTALENIAPMYTHQNSQRSSSSSSSSRSNIQSHTATGRTGAETAAAAGATNDSTTNGRIHQYVSPLDNFSSPQQQQQQAKGSPNPNPLSDSLAAGGSTWDEMSAVTIQTAQTMQSHRSSDLYEFVGMGAGAGAGSSAASAISTAPPDTGTGTGTGTGSPSQYTADQDHLYSSRDSPAAAAAAGAVAPSKGKVPRFATDGSRDGSGRTKGDSGFRGGGYGNNTHASTASLDELESVGVGGLDDEEEFYSDDRHSNRHSNRGSGSNASNATANRKDFSSAPAAPGTAFEHKHSSGQRSQQQQQQQRDVEDLDAATLSAEERLRNLMSDMQRHKQQNQQQRAENSNNSSSNSNNASRPGTGRAANLVPVRGTRELGSTDRDRDGMLRSASRDSRDSRDGSGSAPSLYDLATMQSTNVGAAVHSSNSLRRPPAPSTYASDRTERSRSSSSAGAGTGASYARQRHTAGEDDPLSAFELLQQQQEQAELAASGVGGGRAGLGSSSGRSGGAVPVRARHDIATSRSGTTTSYSSSRAAPNSTPNPNPRPAWGSSGSSAAAAARSGSPQPQPRYTSPSSSSSSRRQAAAAGTSSNSSVGSVGSLGSTGGPAGSSAPVGSGATSGSRVYRHGSPSPNIRPGMSSSAALRESRQQQQQQQQQRYGTGGSSRGRSTGGENALGSGIMGSGGNSSSTSRPSASSGSRYQRSPSPMQQLDRDNARAIGTPAATAATNEGSGRSGSPFLRAGSGTGGRVSSPAPGTQRGREYGSSSGSSSNYSNYANTYTSSGTSKRQQVGSSPLRASYSSGTGSGSGSGGDPRDRDSNRGYSSTGSAGLSSRRFSTTTPQSQQHYDYGSGRNTQNMQAQSRDNDGGSIASVGSGGSGSARNARIMRSSTPTRTSWRF